MSDNDEASESPLIEAETPSLGDVSLSASPPSVPDSPAASVAAPRVLDASHPRFAELEAKLASIAKEAHSELHDELRAKKVDVGAVRDLLRFHLARQLEIVAELNQIAAEEREAQALPADAESDALLTLPDEVLHEHPLIPAGLRAQVWLLLLGCHNKDTSLLDGFDVDAITVSETSPADDADTTTSVITPQLRGNIHIDAMRTRGGMDSNPGLVSELELLLVFYCHSRSVQYKQGLNEILAPLVMCIFSAGGAASAASVVVQRGQAYVAFYSLISKFLPSIFNDSELENLRALFRLFRLLCLYHDPALGRHIEDEAGVMPELYATPWFLTLFAANGCDSLRTLQRLWDVYFIEDDPFLNYFVALALLRRHRAALLRTPAKYLPMVLRGLQIRSGDLLALLAEAKKLRAKTPTSFRQTLFEISFAKKELAQRLGAGGGGSSTGSMVAPAAAAAASSTVASLVSAATTGTFVAAGALSSHLLEQFSSYAALLPCLSVPASEVVQQAYSDLTGEGQIKYILLDVRSAAEYSAGHLPCAIHISPSILHIPSRLAALISDRQYGGMRDQHFLLIGSQAAAFQDVQTPASNRHELNLPAHRRAVPPPSPASSLAALAEATKDGEELTKLLLDAGVPLKDVSEAAMDDAPVLDGVAGLRVEVASPLSPSSSASGVLYRPPSPGGTPQPAGSPSASPHPLYPSSSRSAGVIESSPLLDSALASFVAFFLRSGFKHISFCEGGFPAIHALVSAQAAAWRAQRAALAAGESLPAFQAPLENMELVDHQRPLCQICTPPPAEQARNEARSSDEHANGASAGASASSSSASSSAASAAPASSHSSSSSAAETESKANGTPEDKSAVSSSDTLTVQSDTEAAAKAPTASKDASATEAEKPSALSKFSLGFKKFSAGISDKVAAYKAEKAVSDALKEKERELQRERDAKAAAEKAAARKVAVQKLAAEKAEKRAALAAERVAAEKAAAEQAVAAVSQSASGSASDAYAALVAADKSKESKGDSGKGKDSKDLPLGARFLSALGIGKSKGKSRAEEEEVDDTSELNAAVDLRDWAQDPDNIALFHCHEISLLPATPRLIPRNPPPAPVNPPPTTTKRQGLLLPRVLAVTAGYVIMFQPAKPPTPKKDDAEAPAATSDEEPTFGLAFLKVKYRLIDLDKITSKKDRPSVLTFHWKSGSHPLDHPPPPAALSSSSAAPSAAVSPAAAVDSESSATPSPSNQLLRASSDSPLSPASSAAPAPKGPSTMFLVDRPKECIALVRAKFLLAKASAALAESNKQRPTPEEEAEAAQHLQLQRDQQRRLDEARTAQQQQREEEDAASAAVSNTPAAPSSSADGAASEGVDEPTTDSTPPPLPAAPARIQDSPPFVISPIGGGGDDADDALDL